jgi:hypothetical protein
LLELREPKLQSERSVTLPYLQQRDLQLHEVVQLLLHLVLLKLVPALQQLVPESGPK